MGLKTSFDADKHIAGGTAALLTGQDGSKYYVVKVDSAGHLQADIVGALPAGTNNIGDVDVVSLPDERATSSGVKTADAVIKNSAGTLMGVVMIPDGTNAFTLTIYDNASGASGTVLFKATIAGGSDTFVVTGLETKAVNGLYADGDAGAGTFSYIVYYR